MAGPLKALLLAAGVGTRLKPLTGVLPKCLMPINGRPLLGLWIERLLDAGIRDISINLHHHADLVRTYLERSPYAPFLSLSHEEHLLGTGGTLLRHKAQLAGGPFILAHADNLTAFDPLALHQAHETRPAGCVLTMMTFVTDAPKTCGILELDPAGVVVAFHEKVEDPPGDLANAAVYAGDGALFPFLDRLGRTEIDFSLDVIPQMTGRIFAYRNSRYHRDIGTPSSLFRAQLEYPLAEQSRHPASGDPWHGLMQDDNGRLARDFLRAIDQTLAPSGLR